MKPRHRLVGVVLGIAGLAVVLLSGSPASSGDKAKAPAPGGKVAEKRFTFQMQATPWKKVFEWLADQTGQPVVANQFPTGTFTFIPPPGGKGPRTFTVSEVIDILNEALLTSATQRWILVRGPHSLRLVPADEQFDPSLAPIVDPDELPRRGRSEVVRVILPLEKGDAKDAVVAIKTLQGPFGQAAAVGKWLLLRDTAANLQQIVKVVHMIGVAGAAGPVTLDYKCKYIKATEASQVLENLMGRGSITLVPDDRNNTLNLRGPAERVTEAKTILAKIDVSRRQGPTIGTPSILKTYAVAAGTAEAIAKTLQEKYRESATVRISAAGTSRVLVYAAPDEQIAIARHLQVEMPVTIEAIPLNTLEAVRAVEMLGMLLGRGQQGPTLLADTTRNAIVVRGSREQFDEVKTALRALGEGGGQASTVRVLTLQTGEAGLLAEELKRVLSQMRPDNPVGVIRPFDKSAPAAKPPAAKKAPGAKKPAGKTAPAVTLTALGNKIIVACDDAQVVALVRELVRVGNEWPEGKLTVIPLRNAHAVEVARVLDEVFNGPPGPRGGRRADRVRIVVAQNTNTLLVRASPLDLLAIADLIAKTLDAPSAHHDVAGPQTFILGPLRHASAADLTKVLREVYREGRQSTVTITADPRTNSLILRGSVALYQDAVKLVEQLDRKAEEKKTQEKKKD
jgi:type II secretory pathway component GspD/PulD (secretin)